MAFFCYAYSTPEHRLPLVWILVAIIGTLLLTCVLPASAIWSLIRKGKVSDMQIFNARERTYPYVYTALGFGFWSYLLIEILNVPFYIGLVAVGATAAIGISFLGNDGFLAGWDIASNVGAIVSQRPHTGTSNCWLAIRFE